MVTTPLFTCRGLHLPVGELPHFGADHIGALATVAVVAAALIVLLRATEGGRRTRTVRRTICGSLAAVLLGNDAATTAMEVYNGWWTVRESLPLHLCDFALYVTAAVLIGVGAVGPPHGDRAARPDGPAASNHNATPTGRAPSANPARGPSQFASRDLRRNRWLRALFSVAYFWAIAGTTQALLTPDIHAGYPSLVFLTFFTGHGGIVASVLVLTIGLRMRPPAAAILWCWLLTVACGALMLPINWLLGSNYMFVCGPPARESLYDLLGRWPWSLVAMGLLPGPIYSLCYLPFWLQDRARRWRMADGGQRA